MFNENFWEIVAFLIFVILIYRPIKKQVDLSLKEYSQTIAAKLSEATTLRKEAEKYIKFYKDEHERLSTKCDFILRSTEENIDLIIKNAETNLAEQIAIKKLIHQEKTNIHQKEKISQLKIEAINQALHITTLYLRDHHSSISNDELRNTLQLIDHHQITH